MIPIPPAGERPAAAPNDERRWWDREWLVPTVIAAPFLVTVAALRGMTVALPIFHGSDELDYHYPTILRFARQLPFPDLHSYGAAQTPLFHLVMAYAGNLVGYQLWRLRLLEVAISYALGLAVFYVLRRHLQIERLAALALTLLFVLSPYVFGQSFRLVTDNLALLLSVLALERLESFAESNRPAPFLAACALIAAAILTRQSTAFLLAIAGLYAVRRSASLSVGQRLLALLAVVVSAVPAALLFLNWHGLVPVGGDPSSCGLCVKSSSDFGLSTSGLEVPTAELALATIGLYGAVLFAPSVIGRLGTSWRSERRNGAIGPLLGAAAGGLLLLVFPAAPGANSAGDIWKVAGHLPALDGSSLLFWLLVPLAGTILTVRLRAAPSVWLCVAFAACFVCSAVAIRYPWQKYVDPFALLVLLLTVRRGESSRPSRLAGAAVLAVAFVLYALDLPSHRSDRAGVTPARSRANDRPISWPGPTTMSMPLITASPTWARCRNDRWRLGKSARASAVFLSA